MFSKIVINLVTHIKVPHVKTPSQMIFRSLGENAGHFEAQKAANIRNTYV